MKGSELLHLPPNNERIIMKEKEKEKRKRTRKRHIGYFCTINKNINI
jgi:hypothetical protein